MRSGCTSHAAVRVGVQVGGWIAAVVERERAQVGHRKYAKATTQYGLRVVKGTIREGNARLPVSQISVAKALRQMVLTGGEIPGAWKLCLVKVAGIEGLLEGEV